MTGWWKKINYKFLQPFCIFNGINSKEVADRLAHQTLPVKSSVNEPKFDLVFPGDIKVGDSEDAVKKATAKFNYETETSDSGYTYYEVYDPDGSSFDSYSIVVKDGSACTIEIHNSKEPEY